MKDQITKEKLEKYFAFTKTAMGKIKVLAGKDTHLKAMADDALVMINSYLSDAKHFFSEDDYVNAFAALNYAYGWIDCCVRLGVIDGSAGAGKYFTI